MMMLMAVAMAKNRIRALSLGPAVTRTMATAPPSGENKRLYRRLSALGAEAGGSVAEIIDEWEKEGKAVTESRLVHIVKELRRYKNYKHSLKVINWMEKRGFEISSSIHAIRLDLISKFKSVAIAEKYFSRLPESAKDRMTYGALLNSYCQGEMLEKALALYDKMKELNFASSTLVFNNLMTLHLKLVQHEKVLSLYQEMKAVNIPPDRVTFGILMCSYGSKKDIVSIERVVEEMKRCGKVGFDWSLWCNLAGYYNSAGLFDKAEYVLKNAEKMMPHGDREAYHFLITLYAGAGNLAEVKRVWKQLQASFGKMTNMSHYHMLHALRKLGDLNGLRQCFEEWESFCDRFDVKLVNVVIDAHLSNGMIKEAETIWEKAIRKGFGSDFRTLELFTKYYLGRNEVGLAANFLQRFAIIAKQEKWKPKRKTASNFLHHLTEVKGVDGVEAFRVSVKNLVLRKAGQ